MQDEVQLEVCGWCKGLGQTQPKSDAYQKYLEIKKRRKLEAA